MSGSIQPTIRISGSCLGVILARAKQSQNQRNQQSAKPEKPGQLIVDDTMTKESAKSLKDIKYIYIYS